MELKDFAIMKPHCPVRDCGRLIIAHEKTLGIIRGDSIKVLPCEHTFLDTSQGIKLV